jgi:hypothetical protein
MTTKPELTPERLDVLAVWLRQADEVEILEDSEANFDTVINAIRYLAEILRGSEPVYQYMLDETNWEDIPEKECEDYSSDLVRILYTTPQPDNRDARIAELEAENKYYKEMVGKLVVLQPARDVKEFGKDLCEVALKRIAELEARVNGTIDLNEELSGDITKLEVEIEKLKAENERVCKHPPKRLIKTHWSNTGNYDPSYNSYWTDFKCQVCGKFWIVEGTK